MEALFNTMVAKFTASVDAWMGCGLSAQDAFDRARTTSSAGPRVLRHVADVMGVRL